MATTNLQINNAIINLNDKPLEMFCIVWLDDKTIDKEDRETEQQLRTIINHLQQFQDVAQCETYIHERSRNERLLLVVSGRLGKEIVPSIHNLRVVISIYVYCKDVEANNVWANEFAKVRFY